MKESPDEKSLRSVSFVVHATRGLIRDQSMRRKTMFVLLAVAMVLLFSGSTFLAFLLDPRQHLIWSLLFWFTVVWLSLTAMLLALFDMLIVRANARRAERMLREEYSQAKNPNLPDARGNQ
jgi:small-conductance mechanosensitive channel